ncbi:GTPase activating protein [Punctularia strigosozonata HHB-11173 SS5]|uniref:GTPase activating protein n=1 Tax=Punctularia strigosozonata (strain HHB-11173) TaxID=741275 RepID=UPI0004417F80|nr:GTPase activating protein [Punctularia strigosozonata HHB-11173 SS5]EIN09430.1 GTPase activating protein [Punctularia strigosozonata HHB-11173 SS5]
MSDHGYGPPSADHPSGWDSASWNTHDVSDAAASVDGNLYPGRSPQPQSLQHEHPPSASPPRSSADSPGRPSGSSRWRESFLERRDTVSSTTGYSEVQSVVEPNPDENVLRALCDLDCGVPLLLDRIKQSIISCREASVFFKKRAALEEEYGRNMLKLSRTTADTYAMNDGKAGTFVTAWQGTMRIHETMAENKIRFAQRLNEMSEELANLAKEVDKNRKTSKELANRYERALQESEQATEKSKSRFDMTAEELERVLLAKEGESSAGGLQAKSPGGASGKRVLGKAMKGGGLLLKGKNPGNIARQEDDVRSRMSAASDVYRKAVTDTQTIRQEYFNFQLPRILRALKECADEIDLGLQYHLTRYAYLFESIVLTDGQTLSPTSVDEGSGQGLKAIIDAIDNRGDFRVYMQNYAYAHGGVVRGPRREGPPEAGFLPPIPAHLDRVHAYPSANGQNPSAPQLADKGRPTFGVDLAEQMTRDNVDVPQIMTKCCEAIEKYGLEFQGIYRIGGTTNKIAKLKEKLDKDINSVDLDAEEWSSDITNVTSVLKLWLRELPDPLLTSGLHQGFVEAAKIENDRLRQIRLHERVNDLPDPNYATLKYLMGHLHKVSQSEAQNSMSIQNIAIVFGPTLFGAMPVLPVDGQMNAGNGLADAPLQNKAIETILEHYNDIFVDESEVA